MTAPRGADRVGQWLRCEWCRGRFQQTNAAGPTPRYCKDSCRQMACVQRTALRRAIEHLGEVGMLRAGWVHVDRLPDRG